MELRVGTATLVIVGAVLLGLVGLVLAQRRCLARERPVPEVPVPVVEVVALGISGSGKTVYLASLFHQLHVPADDRPYYLRADAEQRVGLSSVLREVSDASLPWPRGTLVGETRQFGFDCMARTPEGWVPVLRINYLDYAGEVLELASAQNLQALQDLESRVYQADAVIGMLDGRQLLRYLTGDAAGLAYVTAAIQPMVGLLVATRSPVYLVITKWDLVRGFGEPPGADDNQRLALVRHALFALPQLRGLIRTRDIVRLVPVSAVGPHFATLDAVTGGVTKRVDGRLEPMNVEVPLAAVVPDLLKRVAQSFSRQAGDSVNGQVRNLMRMSPAEWGSAVASVLTKPAGIAVRTALATVLGRPFSTELVGMMLEWMSKPFDRKSDEVEAFRSTAERQLYAVAQARIEVLEHFQKTMHVFEARMPESRLWLS
jgi:hypothetical protein